jgi:hypothetical protein
MIDLPAVMARSRQFLGIGEAFARALVMVEGLIGCPYSSAYAATKALVKSLGEGLGANCSPLASMC